MKRHKPSKEQLEAITVTSETMMLDMKVVKRLGFISAEAVEGIGVFAEMFTSVTDFIGGRSRASQNILRKAKSALITELQKEAYALGANAVIGIDLDYSEVSGAGKSMLLIAATGTAVVLEERSISILDGSIPSRPAEPSVAIKESVTPEPFKREEKYCEVTGRKL